MDGAARLVREDGVSIAAELAQAQIARASGNEGRARVCARRAAGAAIREWDGRRGDALKQLGRLRSDGLAPENVRAAARRLTAKVDEDHTLPFAEEPLEDARLIIRLLRK
jgi:hypothetical protein